MNIRWSPVQLGHKWPWCSKVSGGDSLGLAAADLYVSISTLVSTWFQFISLHLPNLMNTIAFIMNYNSKILIHVTVIHLIRNCTRLKLIHTFNTHNWCSEQRLRSASQAAALCTVHPLDLPLLLALQGGGRFPPAHVATLISYSTHWLHFDVSMNLFEYCNLNHGLPLSCFSHHLVRSNKFKSIVRLLPDVLASENAGENSPPSDAGAKGFDLVSSEWVPTSN